MTRRSLRHPGRVGEVLGFATEAVEQPDLGLAFVALGKESDEFAVGAPAGVRRGDAFGGQGDGFAAGGGNHPDAFFVFVSI